MINYKGKPLLGEDSSVSNTSEFFAIAGTILFWLIFLIFSFVIKPQPKKHYKEVQIVLSSTPVVQKTEESPAPAEQAASAASSPEIVEAPAVEAPVETPSPAPVVKETPAAKPVEKKVETPKAQTQPKPAAKKEPAPVKKTETPKPAPQKTEPAEPVLYKSTEELMAEQFANKPKKTISDADLDMMFANMEDANSSSAKTNTYVKGSSTIEGALGSVTTDSERKTSTASKQTKNDTSSDATRGKLGNIANANETGTANNINGKSETPTKGNDKDAITWANGAAARTVYNFDTTLSAKARNSMYVSKATPFTISFSVDANGNVMPSSITISNEFMLTDIIKSEMIEKISAWKFGSGTGISKAVFTWYLKPSN